MSEAAELTIIWRVAVAMALGGVIGLERELAQESAGLRTHMLIAGAAALIVGLGRLLANDFADEQFSELVHIDPVRLIEAVVAAVGFVGAGAILRLRGKEQVQGLTTAASILMVAALGVAVGIGHVFVAVSTALLVLFVLIVLRVFEQRFLKSRPPAKRAG